MSEMIQMGFPGFPEIPAAPEPAVPAQRSPRVDRYLDALVEVFTAPLIVWPGHEEYVPDRLKPLVPLERLAALILASKAGTLPAEATDVEALIYLATACFAGPFDSEWTDIYLYLGKKVLTQEWPEDLEAKDHLSEWEMHHLQTLKRWIKKQQTKKRRERHEG